jgi:predicted nucleic acid-binding protein
MGQLDQRLRTFKQSAELPLRTVVWRPAVGLMATHNLDALDAVHVATALRPHVPDFAASDGHFRRVFGGHFHHIV